MPVVDIHSHIYPHKIASRAVQSVGEFYSYPMLGDGTTETLLQAKAQSPITHFVVHSVAVRPENVESINDFIAQECKQHPELIGFATMHQDYPNPEKEVERVKALGLKGFKLHPDSQHVNMDDPRLMKLYEIIEGDMPIIVHTGDYRYDFSHPRRLKNILHAFPGLVVDAAHFGGWSLFGIALECLENENCFLDASSAMAWLGDRRAQELINIYGTDRILFGSDYPMGDPVKEFKRFSAYDFSESQMEDMLWHNAERFLGFEITD